MHFRQWKRREFITLARGASGAARGGGELGKETMAMTGAINHKANDAPTHAYKLM